MPFDQGKNGVKGDGTVGQVDDRRSHEEKQQVHGTIHQKDHKLLQKIPGYNDQAPFCKKNCVKGFLHVDLIML